MTDPHNVSQRGSEVSSRTRLDKILYAQCWEDAEILLEGLDVQPGDTCLSIASAGDNTLALLVRDPSRVIAVDLNAAQLACLEIRVAALHALAYDEFLELIGSRGSKRRLELYRKCRKEIQSNDSRELWDGLQAQVDRYGVGGVGKFEAYWRMFRRYLLPLIHRHAEVLELLRRKPVQERRDFYDQCWNNWRWRALVRVFGSQRVLSWFGRDPAFFTYVQGSTVKSVMQRTAHAMTELAPAENPFLHWILTGQHGSALPVAYQPKNFEKIRANLSRLEWKQCSVEEMAAACVANNQQVDKFNLSDVFEYMSIDSQREALHAMLAASHRGSRLLYWSMMVQRPIPCEFNERIRSLEGLASELHARDKAFFYRDLSIVEAQ